jgi:hypothetical protein
VHFVNNLRIYLLFAFFEKSVPLIHTDNETAGILVFRVTVAASIKVIVEHTPALRIRYPGSSDFLPPGSGISIRDKFFPDPG